MDADAETQRQMMRDAELANRIQRDTDLEAARLQRVADQDPRALLDLAIAEAARVQRLDDQAARIRMDADAETQRQMMRDAELANRLQR